VITLTESFRQNRQLTFAEQMQANECLVALRSVALPHYGIKAPDKRVRADESRERGELRKRGLFEIADYYRDEPDEKLRKFVGDLLNEAVRDYANSAQHSKGVPPQVAAARVERARLDGAENVQARLSALESQAPRERAIDDHDIEERFRNLEALCGSLIEENDRLNRRITDLLVELGIAPLSSAPSAPSATLEKKEG